MIGMLVARQARRADPSPESELDQPALRVRSEGGLSTLLIGTPGAARPSDDEIAAAIRLQPPAVRARLVLTVYGPEGPGGLAAPPGQPSLAQRLADRFARPVRAHHGVLLAGPLGPRTAVDRAGRPGWSPFALLSTYRPGQTGAVVDRWRAPFAGAQAIGPARYRLTADWSIDLAPAGLVIRRTAAAADPGLRAAPTDPDRVDLVIDAGDGVRLPDDMLTSLGRLADALPTDARARLRVVLTPGLPAISARALRWAVPAPQTSL
jgi:hypothetical protein